jgi:hypothetical protein
MKMEPYPQLIVIGLKSASRVEVEAPDTAICVREAGENWDALFSKFVMSAQATMGCISQL